MKNSLTPENDLQELWEQNGRVKATIQYIKRYNNLERELLLEMLGDPVEGISVENFTNDFLQEAEKDETTENTAEGEF